ncbi:hypothetical protein BGX29_006922 [Mortierella sp. GBA35]|nr:hypothetical protein BGX29_006922 [Mortierella sp. GBA35]
MANNLLNLFCLVDGEATSQAFSVEVDSTKTVDHLKNLLKAEQSPDFDDVVANNLTLWSVSIPDDDNDDEIPIVLDNVNNKDKKRLRATRELSESFIDKPPTSSFSALLKSMHLFLASPCSQLQSFLR